MSCVCSKDQYTSWHVICISTLVFRIYIWHVCIHAVTYICLWHNGLSGSPFLIHPRCVMLLSYSTLFHKLWTCTTFKRSMHVGCKYMYSCMYWALHYFQDTHVCMYETISTQVCIGACAWDGHPSAHDARFLNKLVIWQSSQFCQHKH